MKLDRTNNLKWKFPEFPPRPIKREVLFSLMNYNGGIYFVNESDEVLKKLSNDSFGFVGEASIAGVSNYIYKDINPGESVKVEEYDDFYDLDYMLGFKLYIESEKLGKIMIKPPMAKGGVKAQALVYKDGTTPKYVRLEDTE